jgi:hypothetical protein
LGETLETHRPALFVLAAQTLPAAATALETARFLQERKTAAAYGGRIFNRLPALRDRMPGFFLGEQLEGAAQRIAEILVERPELPGGEPVAEHYRQALLCYDRQRLVLEGGVWQRLVAEGMPVAQWQVASRYLDQTIRAALAFGDMGFLDQEIAWVRGLLANRHIPEAALAHYLDVFETVARAQLPGDCQPVIDWLQARRA